MAEENSLEKNIEEFYTKGYNPLLNEKSKTAISLVQEYLKETKKPFVPKNKIKKEIRDNEGIEDFSDLEFKLLLNYMEDFEYVVQKYNKGTGVIKKPSGQYADRIRGIKEISEERSEEGRRFLSRRNGFVSKAREF